MWQSPPPRRGRCSARRLLPHCDPLPHAGVRHAAPMAPGRASPAKPLHGAPDHRSRVADPTPTGAPRPEPGADVARSAAALIPEPGFSAGPAHWWRPRPLAPAPWRTLHPGAGYRWDTPRQPRPSRCAGAAPSARDTGPADLAAWFVRPAHRGPRPYAAPLLPGWPQ